LSNFYREGGGNRREKSLSEIQLKYSTCIPKKKKGKNAFTPTEKEYKNVAKKKNENILTHSSRTTSNDFKGIILNNFFTHVC
jgi:hypothetical protein